MIFGHMNFSSIKKDPQPMVESLLKYTINVLRTEAHDEHL